MTRMIGKGSLATRAASSGRASVRGAAGTTLCEQSERSAIGKARACREAQPTTI